MQRTSDAEVCRRVLAEGRSAFIGGLDDVCSSTEACTAYFADSIGLVAKGFGATVKHEYRAGLHRAGQALAERLCGELQRQTA